MSESTQTIDLDTIIDFLQQDLASVDTALAINYIEQSELSLQGTDIFKTLMELKQAILNASVTETKTLLHQLSEDTKAMAPSIREGGSAEVAAKIERISQLLAQASSNIK